MKILKLWLKSILPSVYWERLKVFYTKLRGENAYMTPSYSIEGEDRVIASLLHGKYTSRFYVDVGAHHPFRFSNTYLFYNFINKAGWALILMQHPGA